ncbi:MAG: hypothetical protein OEZ03_15295, partial [Alphaproteobacteria bacterium]|nr:hypothetical protein [Alphaproteobacteria bacterium]
MADISAGGVEFRAGRVIAQSFSTFFRNIIPFGLLALVVMSPTYIHTFLTLSAVDLAAIESGDTDIGFGSAAASLGELFLGYLVTAALVYGTLQDMKNNKVSIGECFSQGLARMFPALGIAIVALILTMLGFVLLIVPGFIVMTMLWVAIPVVVTERRGFGSLGRSMELTKGYRWRVFLVAVMMIAILFGLTLPVGGVTAGLIVAGAEMEGL